MSKINEISKRSKEEILNALEFGIKYELKEKASDPSVHIKQSENPLEETMQKMQENKFEVHLVESKEQVIDEINKISAIYNAKSLIYPSSLSVDVEKVNAEKKVCFNKEIEELRKEVFHSDFSIIDVDFALSSHGVACVTSSKTQPRMLSLAPTLCIMLLDKTKIETSLASGLEKISKENEVLPTNILYIAGPSRTSDIELVTVFGVHGSQKVHIIFY
ncbi:LutC/YkgG family protein [Campylobacter canadensis]|uniref:Lactate utilization protein C n=1 Tax=Campylobacter canadensis TaxID=449520 RepID=A0ABS7WRW1_9BACT|nr:lactate utilization protein C [Campylobacter canadensis]MBZ7987111.1 lactate utilization protein C [Campylobacter canadensis]MBZ7994725.1 lactate utilization protein C [Campylobacter canadensis]MBZ7996221.1 lactate utilization protein C [Campylobacter canadensis]MBZ7998147.1 lactate utilization protein C [Campylobacter canadensis]MBZ7999963.1 lactate utilization protein C [Campylobacter canadensis]